MPMIDIFAPAGLFPDIGKLATEAARLLMSIEQVPDISLFRKNTACLVHELPVNGISDADGNANHVRVLILTNVGALDREKQLRAVREFTELVVTSASDPGLKDRTWVQLTEAEPGGWGLGGHAHTNEEIVNAAREEMGASL